MSNVVSVVMDPIESINPKKDSTLLLMLVLQSAGNKIYYIKPEDMFVKDGKTFCYRSPVKLFDDNTHWFELGEPEQAQLQQGDSVFMRLDPPFDMRYIYLTYMLELAEKAGAYVVNKPQSIRDCNEKLFAQWFPQCCPPTVVTQNSRELNHFLDEYETIVCKPLDGMGGASIFLVKQDDMNKNVIFETLTQNGKQMIMAQKFLPEIREGDKRITLINGEPLPCAVARIPKADDIRGNLAAGGSAHCQELTPRDLWLCQQVGPTLKAKGLLWVGLDVIGDYITEINVTSPTCLRDVEGFVSASSKKEGCFQKSLESLMSVSSPKGR
jgi:glutathione synthase